MKQNAVAEPLVNLSEVVEIELFILKRMKERTIGDHGSIFKGPGSNFVGVRIGSLATGHRRSIGRSLRSPTSAR